MVKLTVKFENGSIYCINDFKDDNSCEAWLKEERTRSYWKPSFIVEKQDTTEADKAKEEQVKTERDEMLAKKKQEAEELKAMLSNELDLEKTVIALRKLVEYLEI